MLIVAIALADSSHGCVSFVGVTALGRAPSCTPSRCPALAGFHFRRPIAMVVHEASLAASSLVVSRASSGATGRFIALERMDCRVFLCLGFDWQGGHILTRPWGQRVPQHFQPAAAGLLVLKQTSPRSRRPWTNCCCHCIARYEPAVPVERPIAAAHAHHAAAGRSRDFGRGGSASQTRRFSPQPRDDEGHGLPSRACRPLSSFGREPLRRAGPPGPGVCAAATAARPGL